MTRLRALTLAALLAAALAPGGTAQACGVCVEDKMAAVYDHAVVTRALERRHQVAFFHIDGALPAGASARSQLETLAGGARGVDAGSARVSIESASLSVAFDPRRIPFAELQRAIERRLAARGLSLMLLQVMDRPADLSPAVSRALRTAGK